MLIDHAAIDGRGLSADVCVIGGGPAGLTVAAELADGGVDVIVLEAGGAAYDRHDRRNTAKILRDHASGAQALARGRVTGEPYYPLRMSRARGLGGSTNALMRHGLRSRPLDSIDFRPPRFASGWPIEYRELAAFLPAAEVYAGVRSEGEEPLDWEATSPRIGSSVLESMVAGPFRHGSRLEFPHLAATLASLSQPRVVTSAVVTGLRMGTSGSVQGVDVASLGGHAFKVNADVFVLAGGGIDNARLLLASRPALYAMDAAAEWVGRRFMEHPHYLAGYLIPESTDTAAAIRGFFGDPTQPSYWLSPRDEIVVENNLLRVGLAAIPVHAESLHPAVPAAGELARIVPYGPFGLRPRLAQAAVALRGAHHVVSAAMAKARGEDRTVFALALMSEQAPDPESRIVLGPGRDRLGLPLPELRWRVGERDFTDARRTVELLAGDVEQAGLGRVISLWDEGGERPTVVTGGWHHMGTTGMSSSPVAGVVDQHCRVHGIPNLYVAGSSVFATSGYANPTLTLVALAVRLGRHLVGLRGFS